MSSAIGERIKQQREKRNMKQHELAQAVGTSAQTISRLETGTRQITEVWIAKLSSALGCSAADLLPEATDVTRLQPATRDLPLLDETELMLVYFWRSLSASTRHVILRFVTFWSIEAMRSDGDRAMAEAVKAAAVRKKMGER